MHPIQAEAIEQNKRGVLIVLTGPTGVGKDSVSNELQKNNTHLHRIITSTTRPPRTGESQGHPYHFLERSQFEEKIAQGAFFEWVEFRQELYGTTKSEFEEAIHKGNDVIWIIDLKGTKNIREKVKKLTSRSVFVFLGASEIETLKGRVMNDEKSIAAKRWNESLVSWEMDQFRDCEYLVMNEDGKLSQAVERVSSIIEAKRRELIT